MKSKLCVACPLFAFVSRSWAFQVRLQVRRLKEDDVANPLALQTVQEFTGKVDVTAHNFLLRAGVEWESNEFVKFKAEMSPKLQGIPLNVAAAKSTNRGAVTILPGRDSGLPQDHIKWYSFVVKWNQLMLGPKWGLQIFYGDDSDKDRLEKALGNATNIVWSPMLLDGKRLSSTTIQEYNHFRLSPSFWEPLKFEHVLIFEGDSLVVKPDCVDQLLEYDYVGAPWDSQIGPAFGGNGGFTLRTRSTGLQAVQSPLMATYLPANRNQYIAEDLAMTKMMKNIGAKVAERGVAQKFSIETVNYESPCGFHKPWLFLGLNSIRHVLKLARQEFSRIAKK